MFNKGLDIKKNVFNYCLNNHKKLNALYTNMKIEIAYNKDTHYHIKKIISPLQKDWLHTF